MPVSVSQDEGVTVITITSNPKSNWPILCQILGNLCYRPMCLLPKHVKKETMLVETTLGTVQVVIGILNIIAGILFLHWGISDYIMMWNTPFWLGGVFLTSGILTILLLYFGSYGVCAVTVILNEASGLLALIGVALYSWDLVIKSSFSSAFAPEQRMDTESFLCNKNGIAMTRGTLDITMIFFTILQFCANITMVVMSVRGCVQNYDDPQLHKLLPEEITGNPECQRKQDAQT